MSVLTAKVAGCSRVVTCAPPFNGKPAPAIVAYLEKILPQEGIAFEREALVLIARSAAGSMRDGLSLLDQAIAHGAGRLEAAGDVADLLADRPGYRHLDDALPAAAGRVDSVDRRELLAALGGTVAAAAVAPLQLFTAPADVPDGLANHFADQLAGRYHALRNFVTVFLPTVSALAITLMTFQILFWPELYALAAVEILLLSVGYLSFRLSVREAWHEKWLNDRRLAEGLRAALFTVPLLSEDEGAFSQPSAAASGTANTRVQDPLPFYSPANAWFVATLKRVLRKERRRFSKDIDIDRDRAAITCFVREGWVRDQAEYHARNARRHRRLVARSRRLRLAMIVALALVAAAHAFGVGHGTEHHAAALLARLDLWVAFATISLPAWAAALLHPEP